MNPHITVLTLAVADLERSLAFYRRPWGNLEFAILDPDGNLITFYEPAEA
jgi:catechol 2,3-dioxygenase-like lactoylglutathione lyase family enzyme